MAPDALMLGRRHPVDQPGSTLVHGDGLSVAVAAADHGVAARR